MLFSDSVIRGQGQRKIRGFESGVSNWKKQFEYVQQHKESQSHINAKVAQVIFLQKRSLRDILEEQDKEQELKRQRVVDSNRKILKRVIDTVILLGKQELAFRGHRESSC